VRIKGAHIRFLGAQNTLGAPLFSSTQSCYAGKMTQQPGTNRLPNSHPFPLL
jgi:hypothetical protein